MIIELINALPKEIEERVQLGHVKDEAAQNIICNYKKFCLVIKSEKNKILGVLTAYTAFAEIYVDDIWIDPNYRNQGYGKQLLHELETQFEDKGYNNINLVTSQFQAPEFYKKCGFTAEFVRINKYNPKLTKTFFIKYFNNTKQTQGCLE